MMNRTGFTLCMLCLLVMSIAFSAQATSVDVVYYNPNGGQYYHSNPECETMSSEYYSLMQPIAVSALEVEPYSSLSRCNYCSRSPAPILQTEIDSPMYFKHRSPYNTAPDGITLTTAGEYTVGKDIPSGVYTIFCDGASEGEIFICSENGEMLHTFLVSSSESASFYLADQMSLCLPEGCAIRNTTYETRFQSTLDVTEITNARYFVMVECPGRKYYVQSRPGLHGSAVLYTIEAEMGLTEPIRLQLSDSEPTLLDLSGCYDHFIELHCCMIWPAEDGEG